uniref:Uncharacterized protein n=1 Tax=Glossina palpalis gambiensis TaxID=67801 RepID=A0A1B0BKL5_9MUSC
MMKLVKLLVDCLKIFRPAFKEVSYDTESNSSEEERIMGFKVTNSEETFLYGTAKFFLNGFFNIVAGNILIFQKYLPFNAKIGQSAENFDDRFLIGTHARNGVVQFLSIKLRFLLKASRKIAKTIGDGVWVWIAHAIDNR